MNDRKARQQYNQAAKFLEDGMKLFDRQQYVPAIMKFQEALQVAPNFVPAHLELARSWMAKSDAHSAIREAEIVLAQSLFIDEESTVYLHWQAYLIRAVANRQLGRWELVEQDVRQVLKRKPGNETASTLLEEYKQMSQLVAQANIMNPPKARMVDAQKLLSAAYGPLVSSAQAQATFVVKSNLWTKIPAGKFFMGANLEQDNNAEADEMPQHTLTIPYTYFVSKYLVTVAEFRAFVQDTGYEWDTEWLVSREANHPVTSVNWYDCVAYCRWLTHLLHSTGRLPQNRVARLPTEAEWERSARGLDRRKYPWGNAFDANKCNTAQRTNSMYEGGVTFLPTDLDTQRNHQGELTVQNATTPVGAYSPQGDSPDGCSDMAGNVYEWTNTLYGFSYPYQFGDGRENPAPSDTKRVVRGGSWKATATNARVTYRARRNPLKDRSTALGFRVILAPPIEEIVRLR